MLAKFDFEAQILVPIRTFETLPWLTVQAATVVVLNQQDGKCPHLGRVHHPSRLDEDSYRSVGKSLIEIICLNFLAEFVSNRYDIFVFNYKRADVVEDLGQERAYHEQSCTHAALVWFSTAIEDKADDVPMLIMLPDLNASQVFYQSAAGQ
ncbi:hypothetical protein BDP67DRAFT_495734 [Colletotrichum lupini]|nr:hypothetical protein BDP67DRAFT_495734 [Colletotrichum lupini]